MLRLHSRSALLLPAFLFSTIGFAEEFTDRVQKSFTVQPGGTLTLTADYGHVDMKESTTDNTVNIEVIRVVRADSKTEAQKIFDDFALDAKQSGANVEAKGRFQQGWQPPGNRRWDDDGDHGRTVCMGDDRQGGQRCLAYARQLVEHFYVITLPKKYSLNVETRAGHLNLKDIGGDLDAYTRGGHVSAGNVTGKATIDTAGGHIQLGNVGGPAELETAGGHIGVGNVNGNLNARTAGGHIASGRVKGNVYAKTAGGHIEIASVTGSVVAETSGGGVEVAFAGQPANDSRLETSGGSVRVDLPENIKLDVDAEANGGRIETDFPLTTDNDDTRHSWKASSAHGKLNGGGPKLDVRTSSGSIHLHRASLTF